MALPKFTVAGNLFEIEEGAVQGPLDAAVVAFAANVEPDVLVTHSGDLVKFQAEYLAEVAEDGSFSIELPAEDSGWNFTGLQWAVQPRIRGSGALRRWTFDAGLDGSTVDLASVAAVPAVDVQGAGGLPEQSGHSGEFLTTDGISASWAEVAGGGEGGASLSVSRTATTVTVASDSGTDATLPAADSSNAGVMTAAMQTRLAGITGTNTGDQDLSGYATTGATDTALAARELIANKGAASGYAPLDASQLVPAIYLPSYVDDAVEYPNFGALPLTGETGKIYVALSNNKIYRWSGSAYVEIASSPGSTDAVTEGATNLYYTDTRADARITAARGVTVQPYDATTTSYTSAEKAKLAAITGTNTGDQDITGKLDTSAAPELIRDTIGTALVAGSNVTITPNDAGDTITITSTAAGGGGGDVTLTGVQTLTQKTIGDKLDVTSVSTPAAPSAGTARLYAGSAQGVDAMGYLNSLGAPIILGRDVIFLARNVTGATIAKGSLVYIVSASSAMPNVAKAQSDAGGTKVPAAGFAAHDIANNTTGMILMKGVLSNVDTGGLGDGSLLWVSPTTAGAYTATKPAHPLIAQAVGTVEDANATTGTILVNCGPTLMARSEGVNGASFGIGDGTGAGAKTLQFKNANTGTLTWTPTATRTLTLPDVTDTLVALNATQTLTLKTLTTPTLTTPVLNGVPTGTGVASAATASTLALRDASGNLTAVNLAPAATSTATVAGTTTLTVTSAAVQILTGTTTQTVKLPTTSVTAGMGYTIVNRSTGAVTVQSSAGNVVAVLPGSASVTSATFIAAVATPTTAANWSTDAALTPGWGPLDCGWIAWNFDPAAAYSTSPISAGYMGVMTVKIPVATTITNLIMCVGTGGATLTANQCKACLYQNGTLLASTADQATAWATPGVKTMALTAAQAVEPGYVQVGYWAQGTTMPLFVSGIESTAVTPISNAGNRLRYAYATAGGVTTTAPGTVGAVTSLAPTWVAVS